MGGGDSGGWWRGMGGFRWLPLIFLAAVPWSVVLAAEPSPTPTSGTPAASDPAAGAPVAGTPVAGSLAADPRFSAGSDRSRMEWLAAASVERQVVWLQGDATERFLALYLPNASARTEGGLVILPDAAQHPDWPGLVSGLRTGLPQHGWHTLAIQLREDRPAGVAARVLSAPGAADFPYPGATSRSDVGAEGFPPDGQPSASPALPAETDPRAATNAETERIEEEQAAREQADLDLAAGGAAAEDSPAGGAQGSDNAERINLALQHLTQLGLLNQAVVGVGAGAEKALDHLRLRSAIPERGFALVLIDARFGEATLQRAAEQQSGLRQVILLDLYDSTRREAWVLAGERRQFARRMQMTGFTQAAMPLEGLHPSLAGSALLPRLAGWLKRVVPGQETSAPRF